ncbi:hypothetical protein OF83DRAFT_1066502, partial [Amylostereum chailletii]
KYMPAIRVALGQARKTLNRYYDKTDQSEVYRVVMGVCVGFIYHSELITVSPVLHP